MAADGGTVSVVAGLDGSTVAPVGAGVAIGTADEEGVAELAGEVTLAGAGAVVAVVVV